VCAITYALVAFHRGAPAVLSKGMSEDFKVNTTELTVFSSMYYWTYASLQPFSGLLADVMNPSILISGAALTAASGSFLCGYSKTLSIAVVGRFIVGIGTAPTIIPISKLLTRWYPENWYAVLNGAMMGCGGTGGILSQAPLRAFSNHYSWRMAFYLVSITGFLFGIFDLLVVKQDPTILGFDPVVKSKFKPTEDIFFKNRLSLLWENFSVVITMPTYWLLCMFTFMMGGSQLDIFGLWGGPYIRDVFPTFNDGTMLLSISIAMITASIYLPIISDWLGTRKWVMSGCTLVAASISLIFYLFDQKMSFWVMFVLMYLWGSATAGYSSILFAYIREVCEPKYVATMLGCINVFLFVGGATLQSITGKLLRSHGSINNKYSHTAYHESLWRVILICTSLAIIPTFILKDSKVETEDLDSNPMSSNDPNDPDKVTEM